jgi:uncharacterized protein YqhQ
MRDNKWVRLLASVTGLVNQRLLLQNEYLIAENRIFRSHLPPRLRLSDPERSTLAENGCGASIPIVSMSRALTRITLTFRAGSWLPSQSTAASSERICPKQAPQQTIKAFPQAGPRGRDIMVLVTLSFSMLRGFFRLACHTQILPVLENGEETLVGGQAVMEGVMMRSPHGFCTAVRKADGSIVTEQGPLAKVAEKYPIFRHPVLRGVGTLGQAMYLGIKALRFSANASLPEDETTRQPQEIPGWLMTANLVFSFAFFIFLYKFVPLWLTTKLQASYPAVQGRILFNATDGVIRIAIFLAFLYLLSRYKDIRRVFEYHGAEHKVVFNFESGQPVTVENAQRFVTFHPRCGTSFLLVVMIVSMVVYTFLPFDGFAGKFASRVLLLPLIAGISYEMIRFAAKHRAGLMAALTAPGLWLQRITTKAPADDQVAIAIHALDGAMEIEKAQGGQFVIA